MSARSIINSFYKSRSINQQEYEYCNYIIDVCNKHNVDLQIKQTSRYRDIISKSLHTGGVYYPEDNKIICCIDSRKKRWLILLSHEFSHMIQDKILKSETLKVKFRGRKRDAYDLYYEFLNHTINITNKERTDIIESVINYEREADSISRFLFKKFRIQIPSNYENYCNCYYAFLYTTMYLGINEDQPNGKQTLETNKLKELVPKSFNFRWNKCPTEAIDYLQKRFFKSRFKKCPHFIYKRKMKG